MTATRPFISQVTNETPTDVYRDVLQPTEAPSHVPVERQRALRIFCRVRAPVGGISVKEHLEVNIVPISICLTSALSRKLLTFFFSRKEAGKLNKSDDAAFSCVLHLSLVKLNMILLLSRKSCRWRRCSRPAEREHAQEGSEEGMIPVPRT